MSGPDVRGQIEAHFGNDGPCFLCGETWAGRHRIIDAIRDRNRAGDSPEALAEDYELPLWVVRFVCETPIRKLNWLRRRKARKGTSE